MLLSHVIKLYEYSIIEIKDTLPVINDASLETELHKAMRFHTLTLTN